jgi:beta-lactamase superfamily II metal-dependent hydrolase
MKIHIFDVGHGASAMVIGPNGKRLLIDCGTRGEPFWSPSLQFNGEATDALLITNLDADHVTNYGYVQELLKVGTVWINNTIDAARLALLKRSGGMSAGVQALYQNLLHRPHIFNLSVDFSPMTVTSFRFPYDRFPEKSNNLSLVTFVQYAGFCILFPGDLETEAWEAALASPPAGFIELLRAVNLHVGSHHGRKNGCCESLFSLCRPDAFILSDKEKEHDTQETTSWYARRAHGLQRIIKGPSDPSETRYVFTTRDDNCLTISVEPDGSYVLRTKSDCQKDFSLKPSLPSPPVSLAGLSGLRRALAATPPALAGLNSLTHPSRPARLSDLADLLPPTKPRRF